MIRPIVFALLAANLLYFGWAHWVGDGTTELTAVAAPPPKPIAPQLAKPAGPPPCATLGPFTDELLAQQAQKSLETAGWGVITRAASEQLHEGWWVHVNTPDFISQARTLNAIRRAGINDAFSMPDDPEFRVSVGIFSEESRAEDRAGQVQRLKLDALVTERVRDQAVYWLDVPGVARETLSDGRLGPTGIVLDKLRVESCPVAAPAPDAAAAPDATATPAAVSASQSAAQG